MSLAVDSPVVILKALKGNSGGALLSAVLIIAATGVLLAAVHLRLRGSHWTRAIPLFALQATIYALILLTLGDDWPLAEWFLAWLLLILLPARAAWPSLAVITAVAIVRLFDTAALLAVPEHDRVANVAYATVSFLITSAVVRCLMTLAHLGYQLRIARERVARLGALEERARMSQDLHDTIGLSLTAILMQSELASRELPPDAEFASLQLRSINNGARTALEDVRRVARANRLPRFADELAGAVELLEAAGAECRLDAVPQADAKAAELLGWVLREAVTNVLRHSDVRKCNIRLTRSDGQYRLMIENDGVRDSASDDLSGTGLPGLTGRLGKFGGKVETGAPENGWFVLVATVPAEDERDAL